MQESAQFLAGPQLPDQVLSALLGKTGLKGLVPIIHLSPYDTWLESSAMQWGKKSNGETLMPILPISNNPTVVSYCERSIALQLLQDFSSFNLPARFLQ